MIKNAIQHLKFIKKKPLVLLKIAMGFFNALILKKNVLRTVDFAITYKCHYKCQYCSAKFLCKPNKKEMTTEQILDMLKQADKLGIIHYQFTGGEPTLRGIDELCEIIKKSNPKEHLISFVTNALYFNKKDLTKLKKAGLDTIQLSIESLNPEENDKIRGVKGNFKKTIKALRWSQELKLNICLSTVVTHQNIKNINNLLEFSKKEGCSLLLNKASSAGKWIDKKEMKMHMGDLKLFERLLKIPHTRSDIMFNFRGGMMCPGGIERIYITAYGDVMMCPHVQISYGNVLEEPLENVWKRMCKMPHLNYRSRVCKHAFDKKFYKKYLLPIEKIKNLPVHYKNGK